jgi:hypothetical protein
MTKNPFDFIWQMIFREPPGILQEVGIPINKIIPGCNSYKKTDFSNLRVATLFLKITVYLILRIREDFRMSEKETRGRFWPLVPLGTPNGQKLQPVRHPSIIPNTQFTIIIIH